MPQVLTCVFLLNNFITFDWINVWRVLLVILKEDASEFIRVEISGPNDLQGFLIQISEALDEGQKRGVYKYLVTDKRDSCFSISETFRIVIEILNIVKEKQFELPQIAYLNSVEEKAEFANFAQTVSQNRGLSLRFFTDIESATQWLET